MTQNRECWEEEKLVQRCQKAIDTIQAVLDKPPRERGQVVDFGERSVVRLRDCLIDQFRQADDTPDKDTLRYALEQTNIALSLITGVEYPGAGFQEKPIQEARDILKGLMPTLEKIKYTPEDRSEVY